jgi:Rad3-related DNA helicase
MLSSPTGSGKSVIYMSAARLNDARTLILTSTKGLQAQLLADFDTIGLADVRGQNNYRCTAADKDGPLSDFGNATGAPTMCDGAPCHIGVHCPYKKDAEGNRPAEGCSYEDAVEQARTAQFVVTNYAYWMTTGKFADPGALGEFDLLVLDEAHAAPDELADFCAVRVDRDELKLIGMALPPLDEGTDAWAGWAVTALNACRAKYVEARREFGAIGADRRKAARMLRRLTDLGRGLKELASAHRWRRADPGNPDVWMPGAQVDWVAEAVPTGALFSPVWAHAYAEEYLFRKIPRVVMVSAVLQRATARYLGIDDGVLDYREFPSTFDPKRRPLIYVRTTNVDRHMNEGQTRIWLNRIDAIVAGRLDRKGIIHTRSYERARIITARSKHRDIMITHTSRTTRDAVARFRQAKAPCVIVSPSLEEGYDFPDDQCRYQIIAKVPFVDSRSAIMRARAKSDKGYLNYLTVLSLIQQTGRGMRAESDMCENFIVDDHIAWFWHAAKAMFPRWFKAAWRSEATVPPAMAMRRTR